MNPCVGVAIFYFGMGCALASVRADLTNAKDVLAWMFAWPVMWFKSKA